MARMSIYKIGKYILLALIVLLISAGLFLQMHEKSPKVDVIEEKVQEEAAWPYEDLKEGTPLSKGFDGIDISAYQGRIHWDSLKRCNPNLQFVYIRAVGKKGIDEVYADNVRHARECGLEVGSYHFFNMETPVVVQFHQFTLMVQKEQQDLRPVLDIEPASLCEKGNEHLLDSVKKMARMMEKHYGCKPVIYSNQNFYNMYLSAAFSSYPLWIANYSKKASVVRAKPLLWQKSESGHVKGIWTDVDLNVFINNGTIRDLRIRE